MLVEILLGYVIIYLLARAVWVVQRYKKIKVPFRSAAKVQDALSYYILSSTLSSAVIQLHQHNGNISLNNNKTKMNLFSAILLDIYMYIFLFLR